MAIIRALPHEGTAADHVEILDHEKASAIIDRKSTLALGICSCRHEKTHLGERGCDGPLNVCTSFGRSADPLIRHGMAEEASRPPDMVYVNSCTTTCYDPQGVTLR